MRVRSAKQKAMLRAGAFVLALLQLGVATAFVTADAILDGEQTGTHAHVESHDSEHCPMAHDHLFCQVVRSLTAVVEANDTPIELAVDLHVDVSVAPVVAEVPVSLLRSGASGPRAPPLA